MIHGSGSTQVFNLGPITILKKKCSNKACTKKCSKLFYIMISKSDPTLILIEIRIESARDST